MGKGSLPSRYRRFEEQITGSVVDSIMVEPRSSGRLSMNADYSKAAPPPRRRLKIASTSPQNEGVSYEEKLLGNEDRYRVTYEVQNHRDSSTLVQIVLSEDHERTQPEQSAFESEGGE
jgi:hypothetical protein